MAGKRKISIIGLARSGIAAAELALSDGFEVFLSDSAENPQMVEACRKLSAEGASYELGGHTDRVLDADIIVVSPGVPLDIPIIEKARRAGIPVISEIEFAYRHSQGKIIAVTGSNGKSTTATLIARIFSDAGFHTILAGNIGMPYSAVVTRTTPETITVLELSSFQLEALETFRPDVAVLLNLSPDHLDRYPTAEDYYEAKFRIFDRQRESDYAVLFADQPEVESLAGRVNSQVLWFSTVEERTPGAFVRDGKVFRNQEPIIPAERIGIPGPHNLANALAATAATIPFGVPADSLAASLSHFSGIEHRLERFHEENGILFVNDSKSTNPESLKYALLSFDRPIVLIAGGYDKGADFSELKPIVAKRVRAAVFTGATGQKMAEQLCDGVLWCSVVPDFDEAVRKAIALATPGDVVLLSPGCASFDRFKNFEERGKYFKKIVHKILADRKNEGV
ncbi:UDP-N-acetylmuramoyl-L-alanine--D-glutamate ligase [bacterium]|nr:UDP-N-acetylmuramoyl-L-alanine--D-glutamate ligase [bacterium]